MKLISKKYGILLNTTFLFLALILSLVTSEKIWINCSMVLYILALAGNIAIYRYVFGTSISFFTIFYAFAWILHLSQIILGAMDINTWDNIFIIVDFNTSKMAFTYSFVFLQLFGLAFFCFKKTHKKHKEVNETYRLCKRDIYFISCGFFLLYGYKIIFRIQQILVAQSSNYMESLSMIGSAQVMLCTFGEVFSILYLKYICKKQTRIIFLVMILVFEAVFMLTGSRLYSAIYIMSLVVFMYPELKMKKSNWIKNCTLIIAGLFLLTIVVGVRNARALGNVSLDTVMNFAATNNVITSFIREFGLTQIDLAIAIQNESQVEYLLGSSYYNALFTIIPNIGGIFTEIIENLYFITPLTSFYFMNYGGSFIAETFMNFGYMGILVAIPIGWLIAKTDGVGRNLEIYSLSTQIMFVALVFRIFSWERGYFFALFRIPIWIWLVYMIYTSIITKKIKVKKYY